MLLASVTLALLFSLLFAAVAAAQVPPLHVQLAPIQARAAGGKWGGLQGLGVVLQGKTMCVQRRATRNSGSAQFQRQAARLLPGLCSRCQVGDVGDSGKQ